MAARTKGNTMEIDGKILSVSGWFPKIIRIRAEYHDPIADPSVIITKLQEQVTGDLFSFIQTVTDTVPHYAHHLEWDDVAVLHIESFDSWWKTQLNDKTRNMIRKAAKKGVEIRATECDDAMIQGIKSIYDESRIRQGKPFRHYGKDLAALRESHLTFAHCSEFIGAYFQGDLIGFIKMIYHGDSVSIMQIISMQAHRDKAPTNALLAKAVEICSTKGIHHIQYGSWSRRSMGEFKKHHRFEKLRVPRYFVALNMRGRIALKLRLHKNFIEFIPESWIDFLVSLRARWFMRSNVPATR